MNKKTLSKILSVGLALLMLITTANPALLLANTPDVTEPTEEYAIGNYLYYDMNSSSATFDTSIWGDGEPFEIPFVYAQRDNGKLVVVETEAFRAIDSSGNLLKDDNGNPIVSYCLELGLEPPANETMTYMPETLDESIQKVLYAGYPRNLKNIEGFTESEFEWATAIALRIVEGNAYSKETGESTGASRIRLDEFDFTGNPDCGKFITLKYSYDAYHQQYMASRTKAQGANIVALYKAYVSSSTENLPAFVSIDGETWSFVADEWQAAYDWLAATYNEDWSNSANLQSVKDDIDTKAETNATTAFSRDVENAQRIYGLVKQIVEYAESDEIVIDSIDFTKAEATKKLPAGESEFIIGPFCVELTSASDAELVIDVDNAQVVDAEGNALTPDFGDDFYLKGNADNGLEYKVVAFAKGLDALTRVAYKAEHKDGEDYTQKMYVEETTTINAETEFTIELTPVFDVTITKTDSASQEPVVGAIVNVFDGNGEAIEGSPFTTNDDGQILLSGLAAGSYSYKEVEPPVGYVLNEETYNFAIDEEGNISGTLEFTNDKITVEVTLTKTDFVDSAPVEGAVIEILDANGEPVEGSPFTTDGNGQIVVSALPAGTYTFHETVAPAGYILSDEEAEFRVNEDGTIEGVTEFTNEPTQVVLTKEDVVDGTALPGATIEIMDADGNQIAGSPFETNEDGQIVITKLPAGTYTFHEIVAPAGYILSDQTAEFTVEEDGTVTGTTTLTNEPNKAVITKTDMVSGRPVEGAVIEILDANGEPVNGSPFTTGKDGVIQIEKLPAGTYTFHETVAPAGYILSDETAQFTIKEDGTVEGTTILKNAPTQVVLTKTDMVSGDPVPGATIEIIDANDKVVISGITNSDGEFKVNCLPAGTYKFHETVAPSGYVLSDEICEFTIAGDGTVSGKTELKNAPVEVVLTKTDAVDGTPVPGATIEVRNSADKVIFSGKTDKDGKITLKMLPDDTYTFKETIAPEGYILSSEEVTFTIKDGKVSGKTAMTNAPTSVTIYKIDEKSGDPLAGAKFEIRSGNTIIATETTDKDGKITLTKIPAGTYSFKEVEAPNGYAIDKTNHQFTIAPDGKVSGTTHVSNAKISVSFYKRDLTTGAVLQGATFVIKDANGVEVISATTDANGKITLSKLPAGKYTVQETVAPKGYQLNSTVYSFTVNPDGTVEGTTTIYNKKEATPVPPDSQTSQTTQKPTSTTDDGKGPSKVDTGDNSNNNGAKFLFLGLAVVAAGAGVVVAKKKKED